MSHPHLSDFFRSCPGVFRSLAANRHFAFLTDKNGCLTVFVFNLTLLEVLPQLIFYISGCLLGFSVFMKHFRAFIHRLLEKERSFYHDWTYFYLKCFVLLSGITDRDSVQPLIHSVLKEFSECFLHVPSAAISCLPVFTICYYCNKNTVKPQLKF